MAVDKLVRVGLRDGSQATLLIHIEFQNQFDPDLADRLYMYNVGIYSRIRQPVLTLAVLGDADSGWRPDHFGYSYGGFETRMQFPIAKLLDYEQRWSELEASKNPFAVIVMAHLKTLATMNQLETRLEWKLRLAKDLFASNYNETRIQQLIEFIDWLMVLDDLREKTFDTALHQYEEESGMQTISPYQRRFIAKGRQEGRLEGLEEGKLEGKLEGLLEGTQKAVLVVLALHFSPIPGDVVESIRKTTDVVALTRLLSFAAEVSTLEEFRAAL